MGWIMCAFLADVTLQAKALIDRTLDSPAIDHNNAIWKREKTGQIRSHFEMNEVGVWI